VQTPNFAQREGHCRRRPKVIQILASIAAVQNLANENGIKQKPTALGMPEDFPEDIRTLVTFNPIDKDKTEMQVTEYADFGQISHFAKLGLEQSLDKAVSIFKKSVL
jgi:hypothetical protein